jgi:hypothetical protein
MLIAHASGGQELLYITGNIPAELPLERFGVDSTKSVTEGIHEPCLARCNEELMKGDLPGGGRCSDGLANHGTRSHLSVVPRYGRIPDSTPHQRNDEPFSERRARSFLTR